LKTEEKDKRSRIILFVIISLLFLLNIVLIYSLINKDKRITKTEVQRDELADEKLRLDKMLDEAEVQLTDYKGKNQELDSIINERDKIIANKVAQIRSLLKGGNLTKDQLERAEAQIRSLNSEIASYKAQLDSLKTKNRFLEDEVYMKNSELKDRDSRIDKLETDYDKALAKVKIGSRLEALDLEAMAVKVKGSEKEKEVTKLSKADKIKVSFTISKNEIAEKGTKTVYLKIITPSKSTLHNESAGSGKFVYQGEESLYTSKQQFNFANKNEKMQFFWDKSPGMIVGDYEAYLFCEDHIIGKAAFSLK
jgi:cell division protein FtsB